MYEKYIGKDISAILIDDRQVKGTVEEVLDSTGSLKLGNALIFRSPNDPPRELVSFTIPGNRIKSVSSTATEVSESTSVSDVVSPASNTNPSTIPPESQASNKQLDILHLLTANRSPTESAISSQLLAKATSPAIVPTDDTSIATLEPAVSTKAHSPSLKDGIPNQKMSFMFQTPKINRKFVDTVEMEYDDLLESSKSQAAKSKLTSKAVQRALSEDKTDDMSATSSVESITSQNVIEAKINTPRSSNSSTANSATQSPNIHHPKVDENATNMLLANLNIGKPLSNVPAQNVIKSGSNAASPNIAKSAFNTSSPNIGKSDKKAESPKPAAAAAQPALKKSSSYAIPAGLIPPKARRRESQETSIRQAEEKQQSLPKATISSGANGKNDIPNTNVNDHPTSNIRTVSEGQICPLVTPVSMKEVYTICDEETGPNTAMITESAGVSAAMMALKAIGGQRRIQPNNHNAAPLIVVLAGNNNHVGSYGLTAARHLLNRGCQVIVFIAANANANISQRIVNQEYLVQLAGGQVVRCVEDLPQKLTTPVDIIIDALLGSQTTLADLRADREAFHTVTTAMDWANDNKAPVLSLDFPSGIDPLQGTPYHVGHRINPKWTLCYGAPICGCSSRNVTGELFLADIGVPKSTWKKAKIHPTVPFGSDIIIALEYF
ncbi:enhancer of mRNA decapping [Umbelopsis sp. WA50703]